MRTRMVPCLRGVHLVITVHLVSLFRSQFTCFTFIRPLSFAVSDVRSSDLRMPRPELKNLVIAARDAAAKWHDLGVQLDLPDATLTTIALHPDIESHLRMMLSKWLQYDPEASWEKLADALNTIGKNVIAANIRQRFVSVAPTENQETKRRMCAWIETITISCRYRIEIARLPLST